jgi:hypothetical protein
LPQCSDLFGVKGRGHLRRLELPEPDGTLLREGLALLELLNGQIKEQEKRIAVDCSGDFGAIYKAHRARGKKANTAITIVARRICQIVWHLLQEKRSY